jgi:hypothetical protein
MIVLLVFFKQINVHVNKYGCSIVLLVFFNEIKGYSKPTNNLGTVF